MQVQYEIKSESLNEKYKQHNKDAIQRKEKSKARGNKSRQIPFIMAKRRKICYSGYVMNNITIWNINKREDRWCQKDAFIVKNGDLFLNVKNVIC